MIFAQLSLQAPFHCHCERSVAISAGQGIASSSLTLWGIPRNDGKGCYCECNELISLAENTNDDKDEKACQ